MKKQFFVGICLLVLFVASVLPLFPRPVYGSPDEQYNSPTSVYDSPNDFLWDDEGFTSDNTYAEMGIVSGGFHNIEYFDYDFSIPNSVIDEVRLYCEHKSGHPEDVVQVRLSWNGGDDWTDWYDMPVVQFDAIWDVDFSAVRTWSYNDFTNDNFRVDLQADINATGCYHPDSEVSLWEDKASLLNFDMNVKKISEVKKGDVLLSYDMETGEYIKNVMLEDATIHKEKFTFYRIIAEHEMKLWDKEIYPWDNPKEIGNKDICVTEEQRIFTLEKGLINASEVEVGMHFHGLFRKDGKLLTEPIPIVSIEKFEDFGAVTLYGTSEVLFTHYLMGKTGKTYYLDWIPVRVIYTPTWIDCQHIGVNNTIAGEPTLFSSDWTDINASEGLSHFLFSTNNTGTWQNATWSNSWRDVVWADAEATLNSTMDLTIAFRFYINNTDDFYYASTIGFFIAESSGNTSAWTLAVLAVGALIAIPSGATIYLITRRK